METKTKYCGSGKKQNPTWIKATINVDKIKDFISEYEGNKFVKLNINIKDQADQYGKDVSISIDEFVPEVQNNVQNNVQDAVQPAPKIDLPDGGDLPF